VLYLLIRCLASQGKPKVQSDTTLRDVETKNMLYKKKIEVPCLAVGRYVSLVIPGGGKILSLCEVQGKVVYYVAVLMQCVAVNVLQFVMFCYSVSQFQS